MSDLFIASRPVPHEDDPGRRVLATGKTRGGSSLVQMTARFADLEASGTRPERAEAQP